MSAQPFHAVDIEPDDMEVDVAVPPPPDVPMEEGQPSTLGAAPAEAGGAIDENVEQYDRQAREEEQAVLSAKQQENERLRQEKRALSDALVGQFRHVTTNNTLMPWIIRWTRSHTLGTHVKHGWCR